MKDYYDRIGSQPLFEIGQRVWVYTPKTTKGLSKKLFCNWFGPYGIVEQSSAIPYRLRSKKNKKVTFAVHTNRMKPYLDPALKPIEDDPSKPYLYELDIPADSLEVGDSISHDKRHYNVTAENDTHSLLHSLEDPDNLSQQVDDNQVTVAIDNQSIFASEKKFSKNVIGKATYSITLNGLAIPKISGPGNRRRIFWINVIS